MNYTPLITIFVIHAADVSAVCQAAYKVIEFKFAVEINIDYFLVSLPQLLLTQWSDCDYVVESIILSILTMCSWNILDDKVKIEACLVLVGWEEGCFWNSNLKRVHASLDSWLLDEGGHVILEADNLRRMLVTLKWRSSVLRYNTTSSIIDETHRHLNLTEWVRTEDCQRITWVTNGNFIKQESKIVCLAILVLVHGLVIAVKRYLLCDSPCHTWEGPWLLVVLVSLHMLFIFAFNGRRSSVKWLNNESQVDDGTEVIQLVLTLGWANMLEFEGKFIWSLLWIFAFWSVNDSNLCGSIDKPIKVAFIRRWGKHNLAFRVE